MNQHTMKDATVKRLYVIAANAVPLLFIIWLTITLYDRYVQHDRRQYLVLGLWLLMMAVFIRRLVYLYRHGWDATAAVYGEGDLRRRLYIYAAIITIMIALNLLVLWLGN